MVTAKYDWDAVLAQGVEKIRQAKRAQVVVDYWFFSQEIRMEEREAMLAAGQSPDSIQGQAELLCRMAERIPLRLFPGAAVAGDQDCAFSPSYALINPSFQVETFAGYCDPTAMYADIAPRADANITQARIDKVRGYWEKAKYTRRLADVYKEGAEEMREVAYFVEPVTGHTIPDFRPILRQGIAEAKRQAIAKGGEARQAMARALDAAAILAKRYSELASAEAAKAADAGEKERFRRMADVLQRVPAEGARTLHEAVQSFLMLWQAMVLEQAPNPYAFSVGNLDRILNPYYDSTRESVAEAVQLVRNLLCFFEVGSRCWAISQNLMVGGRDASGKDLTNPMTEIVLEAFFQTNDPQPALSVKVHAGTPKSLYESLGRFFFTPGQLTPSLFNDDTVFPLLAKQGVAADDLADYSIAGCQEPLIMGKASLNTTNTWLNLAKVLELALNDGKSTLTGKQIGLTWKELGFASREEAYAHAEDAFFKMLDYFLPRMAKAGNACTTVMGEEKPVPFTSAVMEGITHGRDMRAPANPGSTYAGSGCLIHGLSVVADSIHALRQALAAGKATAEKMQTALANNFANEDALRRFLMSQEKYGNNHKAVDALASHIARSVSERVSALRNPAGKAFLADWSTPSTHLLYGFWVGATPDGRPAREMLGYGIDPRPAAQQAELPERLLSTWKLPFLNMTGGYASHIGLRPARATGASFAEKGLWLRDEVIKPLFRLDNAPKSGEHETPYYVYFNIDEAAHLREVLKNPRKYAPNGIYIMRIHGTFVNFLDLSPAIQEDIIARLEPVAS